MNGYRFMAMVRLQEVLVHNFSVKEPCFQPMRIASRPGSRIRDEADERVLDLHLPDPLITQMICVDFLPADMIPQLKSVADAMFASNHGEDFCQALIGFARASFRKYLAMHEVKELCFDNIQEMKWNALRSSINKWRALIKNFIGYYLGNAKNAFDEILGEYGQISLASFIESSQASVMSLLDFGDAIVTKPHEDKLDSLYIVLRMYRDVASLCPDMDTLFLEGNGSFVLKKFNDLLTRLKHSVKESCKELGNLFRSCHIALIPDGSIHPLTRNVMNHICCLGHHDDTLNLLLEEEGENNSDGMPNIDVGQNLAHPLAAYVQSLTSVLEARLDESSNSYKDWSWKHFFMMNNIHYIVRKVSHSGACGNFGKEWIRIRVGKFQWHAMCYHRLTWNHVVNLIRDNYDDTRELTKATLKGRSQAFATAFDDVYRSQRRLHVPNYELREDLRLLTSQTVVYAYRIFVARFSLIIGKKHIKYTVQDLENYIMDDLLEGSSKSVTDSKKRGIWFTLTHSK